VPGIFPGGKVGRCIGLTTLPPLCADFLEIWEPDPPGTLRACPGLQWDCFTFALHPYATPKVMRLKINVHIRVLWWNTSHA